MAKLSQSKMLKRLQQTTDPTQRRDLALDLLGVTLRRDYIDAALRALEREEITALLGDIHRPVLREKTLFYFEQEDRDRAGLIREKLTCLLAVIGHPDDIDIYRKGVVTYHRQPVSDTAQNLRAAALVGLARVDQALACTYAVKLLGEPDTSQLNCEPSMTAVRVLERFGRVLPVYQFLLLRGEDFLRDAQGEVVGLAFESLGADFPVAAYRSLAEHFIALDAPAACSGIINYITMHRVAELYPMLHHIASETRHDDLHRYAVIMLAAARVPALTEMLYRLAKLSPAGRVANFVEAVELTPDSDDREALLETLAGRVR